MLEKYFLFLVAAYCTMWLNVALSRPNNLPAPFDLMEAALGALYISASSPKNYPGW